MHRSEGGQKITHAVYKRTSKTAVVFSCTTTTVVMSSPSTAHPDMSRHGLLTKFYPSCVPDLVPKARSVCGGLGLVHGAGQIGMQEAVEQMLAGFAPHRKPAGQVGA